MTDSRTNSLYSAEMNLPLVLIFSAVALVKGDLNEVKKNALKKVDVMADSFYQLANETILKVDKVQKQLKVIINHEREFGDGVIEKARFEINRTAEAAYMLTDLLGTPNDVFKCIEAREREAVEAADKYHRKEFLDVGKHYEAQIEERHKFLVNEWNGILGLTNSMLPDEVQEGKQMIKNARNESEVSEILQRFGDRIYEFTYAVYNILSRLKTFQAQAFSIFYKLTHSLQQYANGRVEETTKSIQKCFPQFFKTFLKTLYVAGESSYDKY